MEITKSLGNDYLASATGVAFKQEVNNNAALFRPEKIICIGQAQTGKTIDYNKTHLSSNSDDVGILFGFGSPLHRMAKKLFPKAGNGSTVDTYFMAVQAPTTAAAETKTITATASSVTKSFNAYLKFRDLPFEAAADIAGKAASIYNTNPALDPRGTDLNSFETTKIPFSLLKGMTATQAIEAIKEALIEELELPFTLSASEAVMTLTAKWAGSDSKFFVEIVDEKDNKITAAEYGISFEIATTKEAAGQGTIADSSLSLINEESGFTRVISQYSNTLVLDKLKEKFNALHDPLIAQYVVCYSSIEAPEDETNKGTYDKKALITLGTARRDDFVNVQIVGDYGNLRALDYKERNQLLDAGFSNIVKKSNGGYRLMDLCTFYHPIGNKEPMYKFDRDITVIANSAYDFMTYFRDSEEWKSVFSIAENDLTTNPAARTLKQLKAAVNTRISLQGQAGLIADYVKAQKNTKVVRDSQNSKRFNMNAHFNITSVARIFDLTNFVSFYFGN